MRLFEFIDTKKPENLKTAYTKKSGVQGSSSKVTQKRFVTKSGNDVKVMFEDKHDGVFDVYFYVNDTMHDRDVRDADILPMVMYVISKFSKLPKVKTLTFNAISSPNDTKVVRGLDINGVSSELASVLRDFLRYLSENPKIEVDPSERKVALFKKLGKELTPTYNIPNHDELSDIASKSLQFINARRYENALHSLGRLDLISLDGVYDLDIYKKLNSLKKEFTDAVISNTESGLIVTKNRRLSLYTRLVKKFFPDWDIDISGTYFTLNKREDDA